MLRTILTTLAIGVILAAASDTFACYAAIAYSPSTRSYGYSYGFDTKEGAEAEALSRCNGSDRRIVAWALHGYCALAHGDGTAYGYGWSPSADRAKLRALEECSSRTSNAHIVVCVYSGD